MRGASAASAYRSLQRPDIYFTIQKTLGYRSKHFTPGAKKFELNLIRTCRRGKEIFFVK